MSTSRPTAAQNPAPYTEHLEWAHEFTTLTVPELKIALTGLES